MQWQNYLQRSQIDKLAPFILLLLLGWLCWRLASLVWWIVAPPQAPVIQPVALGSQQPIMPDIVRFSLFQNQTTVPTVAPVAPTSVLPIKLEGVLLSSQGRSSAVLRINDRADSYRVGQKIPDSDYRLVAAYWNKVVLRDGGGVERVIKFGDPLVPVPVSPEQNSLNPSMQMPNPTSSSMPLNQGNGQINNNSSAFNQAIQSLQTNREQYLNQMGVAIGKNGLEISDRTPPSLRSKWGLRPGDRVVSVNGQPLTAGMNEVQLLEQVKASGQARIEIQRGDQTMTVQQSF